MKIEVINKKLVKAIKNCKEALSDSDSPFCGCILIERVAPDKIAVTAMGEYMIATCHIPAEVHMHEGDAESDKIVISADRILAGIENSEGIAKIISFKRQVQVYGNGYSLTLKLHDVDDFVKIRDMFGDVSDMSEGVNYCDFENHLLNEMFIKSFYAVDVKYPAKPILRYLHASFDKTRGVCRFEGTDGKRLAFVEVERAISEDFDLCLPVRLVKMIKQFIDFGDPDLVVGTDGHHGFVSDASQTWILRFTLPNGSYPSTVNIIPDCSKCIESFRLDRTQFIKALKITGEFEGAAREESLGVIIELCGLWTKAAVKIVEDDEIVADASVLAAHLKGSSEEKISFYCRAKFLLDTLRSFEDDDITLEWYGNERPIVIRASVPALAVIMPLRISKEVKEAK